VSSVRQKNIVTISFLLALTACSGANTEPARSNELSSRAALAASAGDTPGSRLPDNRAGAGMTVALENRTNERDLQQRLIALEQSLIEQNAALERLRTIREDPDAGRRTRTLIEENQRILRGAMQPSAGQIAAADAETPAQRAQYENVLAAFEAANRTDSPGMRTFEAYRAGRMTPEDAATFEQEVRAGNIMLPRGAGLIGENIGPTETRPPLQGSPTGIKAPQGVLDAYTQNRMTQADRITFEGLVKSGEMIVPPDFQIGQTPAIGRSRAAMSAAERRMVDAFPRQPVAAPAGAAAPVGTAPMPVAPAQAPQAAPTVAAAQAARLQSKLDALERERRAAASRAGGPSAEQVQSLERRAIELEVALQRFERI
jgi:hypothetical protein